eukprot:g18644.t1
MEQPTAVAAKAASVASAAAAATAAGSRTPTAVEPADSERGCQERDGEGLTPFLQVVRTGSPEVVARLIETHGESVLGDCANNGTTCLHLAAERQDNSAAALVRLLLDGDGQAGRPGLPHVDARDKQSFTPLHLACTLGNLKAARELLRRGAAVGATNERGSTPLHWAASRGHVQVVKLLVGVYGAEFTVRAGNGSTPLHWAASKGKRAVIEVIAGNFCAPVDVKDDKGCTPCLMAALNGHIETVELLVDRFKAKITICDRKRTNLLHAACEMGHGVLASALIERYNFSVEDKDRKGLTPLARAAQRNQMRVFRLLVEKHGAQLDTLTANKSGLLHVACEAGALDIAKLLLEEHRFEVDARNSNGDTPALLAAARGNADVLSLLVDEHGASLDAADANGVGALHVACERRQSGVASVLLESYGLPADKVDPSGATPLHVAARAGDTELVELLIGPSGNADIGLRDGEGSQALHIAAAGGHLGVVKILVEKAGADLGARDRSEKSPLDVAVGNANTDIADYLREMLPDKHLEQQHSCKKRAGFERAGRWMRLSRASGYLQDLALDSVFLLPISTLLETGRFPSYYDASRKKQLVAGSAISPQSQVLLVSHPWESPGNPDPSGKQFLALLRFLAEAEGGGGGFAYVWLSFSCTSSNRMKPTFQTHLNNVLTAWCFSDHALVIPETVTRPSEGFTYTDVEGFVERGWCCVELLCALHLDVPTTIHVALEDALSDAVTKCQLSPSEEEDTDLDVDVNLLPPSSVFELLSTEEWRSGKDTPGEASQPRFVSPGKLPSPTRNPDQGLTSKRSSFEDGDGDEPARPRLSAGRCVTRAMEAASYRLSSSPAAFASPVAVAANGGGGGFVGGSGSADDGSSQQQQQQQQQEATEESAHIVNLMWSKGAESYLDSITQLVADVLKSLDDEVSRDVQAAAAAAAATGDGDETPEAKLGGEEEEEEVPKDSKAGLLLARVLSLGLEKQDVEEDGGGGEAEEAAAAPLVRELYERLGSCSSTHEKQDAVKTLLLAACYFEGVRSASTGVSRGSSSSPKFPSRAGGEAGLTPSPPRLSGTGKERGRLSGTGSLESNSNGDLTHRERASGGGQRDSGRKPRSSLEETAAGESGNTAPMAARSVPSCHVS